MGDDMKKPGLATLVMIGMVAGIAAGAVFSGNTTFISIVEPLGTIFVRMFKMIMVPIVVASLVVGVAGSGDAHRFGRLGVKTLLYFEVLTTVAIVIGLLAANIIRPGVGVSIPAGGEGAAASFAAKAHSHTIAETLITIVPTNIVDSLAKSDMLAVIFFSVMFGLALASLGERGASLVKLFKDLSEVMFALTRMVMRFAPIGVFAMISLTVAKFGVQTLLPLIKLTLTVYGAMIIFIAVVIGSVCRWLGIGLIPVLRSIRDELFLAFSTASSETVLPNIIDKAGHCGAPPHVASFVIPTGYTFNLDGSTLYQSLASLFIAQMYGIDLSLFQQITLVLTLMLTSKGIAGVPGASLVVLTATLGTLGLPVEGLAIILGIDRVLDMGRTVVNVVGNYVAALAVAKLEGEFNKEQADRFLAS
jgi:proton glutamate symport protein